MADHAVENARRRRDEFAASINKAQQEIEEWRRQIARVDRFLADYEAFAADTALPDGTSAAVVSQITSSDIPRKSRAVGNSPKEDVAAAARRIIANAERPIPREELYDALIDDGLSIDGTDRLGVMNTMLWRTRDEFGVILLKNVGYWLKEKIWEPASYWPDLDDIIGAEESPSADNDTESD